jgi:hypothetical protein
LCVCFPDPSLNGLPGISLDYTDVLKPIRFPGPFSDLPAAPFTIQELIDMLDRHGIQFDDSRPDRVEGFVLTSEGGVAASSRGGNCSPKARVAHLFPHEFERA